MTEERRQVVDEVPMRWLERGAGSPVVLLHGLPTSPSLWRRVLPRLDGVRAIAWELVGFGWSWPAGRRREIGVAAQAGYLARFLEEEAGGEAVLVGHDLGGGVAQIVAVERPDLVRGLVLTNSIGYDAWPIPSVKALRAVDRVLEAAKPGALRPIFSMLMLRGHGDLARAREAIEEHLVPYGHEEGPEAFARQLRSLRAEETRAIADRLPEVAVPAAVVWGAADPFLELELGRRLAEDLRAELEEIEGGRHFVPEDHPGRVSAAVGRVLEAVHA